MGMRDVCGAAPRALAKVCALALAFVAAAPCSSFAQNLIQNSGFETNGGGGLFTQTAPPWSLTQGATVASGFANTGSWALFIAAGAGCGCGVYNGSATQAITVARSGLYSFSFFEEIAFAPGNYGLTAAFNGTTAVNAAYSSGAYNKVTTNVKLNAGQNILSLHGTLLSGSDDALALDDFSLTFLQAFQISPNLPINAPLNAVNVAGAIDNFSNNGGTLPQNFANLSNLSGVQLVNALLQLDGETSTGAEKGAFQLMNQFLGLMLDPFVDGRFGAGTSNFAPDREASLPPDIAMAYASVLKAPPKVVDNRWSVWGTGFGSTSHANGDPAIGSSDVTASTYGFASGADYHFTRDALAGFALAGAGTNWGLSQFLGSGRSDAFQAGVYGKTAWGPVYLAAAFAYTENWFTTNRLALGDQLTAKFNGESYGGRLESGYRFVVPSNVGQFEISPYGAIQAQSFHTPNYSETDLTGGGLGLNFNAMNATDTRSELGARFADMTAVNGMPLILRARLAWAHDWVDNPALNAVFQALPGSSFVVNGAPIPSDSALASVGAELHMTSHWSATAKFDGEFASNSQIYAGTGTLRYTW